MYDVIFWHDEHHDQRFVVAENVLFLTDAKNLRNLAGDIVVHHGTRQVVSDPAWLWDWEQKDEDGYAQRMIKRYSNPGSCPRSCRRG